ncbi:MAG: ATP-binding protein [Proteobacteria bacterium]|nr:ATP-binding protein [Pseudomonadota bacterium]
MALFRNKKEKLKSSPEHQRQIRNRIGLILFLFVLIVTLLLFNYYQQGLTDWKSIDANLNIFLLINLNILLLVTVILLIIRNLVKLVYERKKRKLGFRLKYKLTLAFMLVSSLPMLMFFFIAHGLLKDSLDFWFKGQISLAVKNSSIVVNNLNKRENNDLKVFVQTVANDYKLYLKTKGISKEPLLDSEWFANTINRYRLDGITIYNASLVPVGNWFVDEVNEKIWEPLPREILAQNSVDFPYLLSRKSDNGKISRSMVPIQFNDETFYLEISKILAGSDFEDLVIMQANLANFRNLTLLENPIRANFTTYLLLFTVLIIFGGIWFGYYLAGSIVEPIEILVGGTRRISKGDVDFQIDLQVDDEIGMLLDSFNSMTKELLSNRRELAISQEALIDTNKTLEERNVFVELVLQNIQTGILSVDNSGYVNGINPYMIRLFQIDPPAVLQKHYLSVLTKEQKKYFEQLNQELTDSEQTSVKKDLHLKMEKRTIHVSMELFQLENQQGEPLGRLLVVDNLTEIDRSTRANAWREVARRIAHEIKNPLTPIQLSTQRIRRQYLENIEEPDMLDSATSTIIREVNGLKKMVNEFSKFARLPEIIPSPNSINDILKDVCDLFNQGLPGRIQLNLIPDPLIPKTLLDAEQMKRVFTNLIDNAISAINGDGRIDLISSYYKELKIVTVDVVDNGSGIPVEMMYRIFDPYVTTKKEGTGLGLAIVQQIISDHGGFIRLKNMEDQGTKFTIELPA